VAGATALSAGGSASAQGEPAKPPPTYADYLKDAGRAQELEPVTDSNIEGPFYRPGAPFRTKLYQEGDNGDVVLISGTVVARNGRPIPGAVLDVWHTSSFGRYDNDDPEHPPAEDEFRFRARIRTDAQGRYQFETIRPGHYKITPTQYRTAHIHLKVQADGYQPLTTQFFFKGERYNKTDPWFKPSMVLDLKPDGEKFRAAFKIVMAKA
jgi:protocatechuate 3,4-dioxygenase beta subunit